MRSRLHEGFTLSELLVHVAIIGIVAAVAILLLSADVSIRGAAEILVFKLSRAIH